MLKRLRSAHPMLYCLGAEVLFLGMLFVASMVSLLGILFVLRDLEMADDYLLTTLQEAAGILTACFLLARTGKIGLLRRRGSGFFNGLLVGLYPIALISYNAYNTLLFGRPEGDMLPAWRIVWFLLGMTSVGVAEEFLFRGVIAQTLLEHFGTSRGGVWKACLLSGLYFWRGPPDQPHRQRAAGRADAVCLCGIAGHPAGGSLFPHRQHLGDGVHPRCDGHHLHAGGRLVRHPVGGRQHQHLRHHHAGVGGGLSHPHSVPAAEKEDRRSGALLRTGCGVRECIRKRSREAPFFVIPYS